MLSVSTGSSYRLWSFLAVGLSGGEAVLDDGVVGLPHDLEGNMVPVNHLTMSGPMSGPV